GASMRGCIKSYLRTISWIFFVASSSRPSAAVTLARGAGIARPFEKENAVTILPLILPVSSSWLPSTSSIPTTSDGYSAANRPATVPPAECPTNMYGGGTLAFDSARCRSKTSCAIVCGTGPRSLHASPARSYQHTRVSLATSGCTRAQSNEKSPLPDDKTTVGLPFPVHQRCIL